MLMGIWKRHNKKISFPLRNKFMVGIILLQILLMSAIVFMMENQMRTSVMEEFLKRGYSIARNLAATNTGYVATYNYVKIKQSVDKIAGQSGLIYASILLFNGEVASQSSSTDMEHDQRILDDSTIQWALQGDEEKFQYRHVGRDDICDISVPILFHGEQWGRSCIGLSSGSLNATILNTRLKLCLLGGIGLIFGCVFAGLIARRITRPIASLVDSVEAISNREYSRTINIRTNDEIGYLGERFSIMQQQLKEHIQRLSKANEDLKSSNTKLQREILERKRAEREIEKHRHFLEHLVAERTKEVEMVNNQLRDEVVERKLMENKSKEASKAAEAANQAKTQFLANMSHEIRTPLNGVLGVTDLLSNTHLTDKQNGYVTLIKNSGDMLLKILNDVLDISKIEAGKLDLESINFNLRHAVEEVTELFAEQAERKGLDIACLIDSNVHEEIHGDRVRLNQILINLVGNAIKFCNKGQVLVQVSQLQTTRHKVHLRFEVIDTGIGISTRSKTDIFDAFSQADCSTYRIYGGTGLGLTICKKLVNIMDGDIGFNSELGKGSTFWFTVVLNMHSGSENRIALKTNPLNRLKVLVIDDSTTRQRVLENYLTSFGMQYTQVESGKRALEILQCSVTDNRPFDVAIFNNELPDMDGAAFSLNVIADTEISDMGLIMLVPHMSVKKQKGIQPLERIVCLNKPIRQADLCGCLTTAIGGISPDSASTPTHQQSQEIREIYPCRVLLAEDEPVNQEVTRAMLEYFGCQVEITSNGLELLEALRKADYDLILLDGQMPKMDGYTAARAIREKEADANSKEAIPRSEWAHIPIIGLSGNVMADARKECLSAGMDDYLNKPISQDKLRTILKRWFPKKSNPAGSTSQQSLPTDATKVDGIKPALRHASFDPKVLMALTDLGKIGGANLLGKVFETYLTSSVGYLQELREAISNADADTMKSAAHAFKSSNENVGAHRLSRLLEELEKIGNTGSTQGASTLLSGIEAEYKTVQTAFRNELKNMDVADSQDNGPPMHTTLESQQESNIAWDYKYK